MNRAPQTLKRIVNLAFVFAVAYMIAEMLGYGFGLVPGIFPLLVAAAVTLLTIGGWQWRRASAAPVA